MTPDTALRLARVTGMDADFRMGLQQDGDLWQALTAERAAAIALLEPSPHPDRQGSPFSEPSDILLADIAIRVQLSQTNYNKAVARYKALSEWIERDGSPLAGRGPNTDDMLATLGLTAFAAGWRASHPGPVWRPSEHEGSAGGA